MRFKQQVKPPELNLVPMLDVLMTVLTFFIVVSMTLTLDSGVEVELPNSEDANLPPTATPDPLIVRLDPQGQLFIGDRPSAPNVLASQMQIYLSSNKEGFVVLQADPDLPYQQVVQVLGDMKEIGGDRVSLAIE